MEKKKFVIKSGGSRVVEKPEKTDKPKKVVTNASK